MGAAAVLRPGPRWHPHPVPTASSPAPAATPAWRVLFLGGLGRSGSTVLERVLGELPRTTSVGELVHLWQRGVLDDESCGCGEPFSRCPFWKEVGSHAFGGWSTDLARRMLLLHDRVDRSRYVPRLLLPDVLDRRRAELREYVDVFTRLYGAIAAVSGAEVVVDSSKHPSLATCLRVAPELDLRVVHVVRDSRGVAYSWTKQVARPEGRDGEVGRAMMARYSPGRAAALWTGHNLTIALLGLLGVRRRLLRYEDFIAAPGAALADVAAFAGLPVTPAQLGFVEGAEVEVGVAHTVSGNPMRFETGLLTLRRDDTWRTQLSRPRRLLVSALTLPLLLRYGYLRPFGRTAR